MVAAARLPRTPEALPFKMPRVQASTDAVHAAAMGMASAAVSCSAVFTAAGLPRGFIAQIRVAAEAMLDVPIPVNK